jgi:hypothetical protein
VREHRLGGIDASQRAAVRASAEVLEGLGPERGGIRVEPEDDTTAALVDERRKPVGEM